MQDSQHELKTLINSFHSLICIVTPEEERALDLVRAVAAEMRLPIAEWSASSGLKGNPTLAAAPSTKNFEILLGFLESYRGEALFVLKDLSDSAQKGEQLRRLRELLQKFALTRSTLIVVSAHISLPAELQHKALFFDLKPLSRADIVQLIKSSYYSLAHTKHIEMKLSKDELETMADALSGLTIGQIRQAISYAALEDHRLDSTDVKKLLNRKAQMMNEGGLLEYYPPDLLELQLGGFANLKKWSIRARVGFSEKARELNLPVPKGILLVGVPGCGKSLAAKVLAKTWQMPLVKMDAGRLFEKFIAETQKNFRKAIQTAEAMAPCILWIDEIEKAIFSNGGSSNDGGLSQRLFGAFLTWMQEKSASVFVVATANAIEQLPPELLRKGRFDEVFFVDLPTPKERQNIFEIHIRRRNKSPGAFDVSVLARLTEGFSGAEIEQCVIGGAYRSLQNSEDMTTQHLADEIASTMPLSRTRSAEISALRSRYKDNFVSVSEAEVQATNP